jgi:hypothetical protein
MLLHNARRSAASASLQPSSSTPWAFARLREVDAPIVAEARAARERHPFWELDRDAFGELEGRRNAVGEGVAAAAFELVDAAPGNAASTPARLRPTRPREASSRRHARSRAAGRSSGAEPAPAPRTGSPHHDVPPSPARKKWLLSLRLTRWRLLAV